MFVPSSYTNPTSLIFPGRTWAVALGLNHHHNVPKHKLFSSWSLALFICSQTHTLKNAFICFINLHSWTCQPQLHGNFSPMPNPNPFPSDLAQAKIPQQGVLAGLRVLQAPRRPILLERVIHGAGPALWEVLGCDPRLHAQDAWAVGAWGVDIPARGAAPATPEPVLGGVGEGGQGGNVWGRRRGVGQDGGERGWDRGVGGELLHIQCGAFPIFHDSEQVQAQGRCGELQPPRNGLQCRARRYRPRQESASGNMLDKLSLGVQIRCIFQLKARLVQAKQRTGITSNRKQHAFMGCLSAQATFNDGIRRCLNTQSRYHQHAQFCIF